MDAAEEMVLIDLSARLELVASYVALRNRFCDLLLTHPVDIPGTERWLAGNQGEILCLVRDGMVAGAVILYTGRGGEIAIFTAEPGRGWGGLLLRAVRERAEKLGLPEIWAWVMRDNLPSRRLFRRCGFEEKAETERVYDGRRVAGMVYTLKIKNLL